MFIAHIESQSEISSLNTIAYGETVCQIAEWYADEVRECLDLYGGENVSEEEGAQRRCCELCELAESDALELCDLDGTVIAFGGVSIEIVAVYNSYEEFRKGFCEFVSDKPKYKKILPQPETDDEVSELDRINTLLIRACV